MTMEWDGTYMQSMGQVTGLPGSANCGSPCYWTSQQYGAIPSFARTWYGLTNQVSYYVIRPKGGSGLTQAGDTVGNGYWTDYSNADPMKGIYRNAVESFKTARGFANSILWSVNKSYVIWLQGEQDAYASVSSAVYQSKLQELFAQLNQDVSVNGNKPFDGMFIVSTGYFPGYYAAESYTNNRNKVDAVVSGQDNAAAATANIVAVSRAPRVFMSACFNGIGSPGCESVDKIHYLTSSYEALGAEMARNAYTFHSTGIKPLLASSCQVNPSKCSGTVDVFRWAGGTTGLDHASGIDSTEFDANYVFKGVRFQLFQDPAPGRVELRRLYNATTGDSMDSTTPNEGSPGYVDQKRLGFCYTSATANAPMPLMRLRLNNNRVTTKNLAEANAFAGQGYVSEGTLCYVN